MCIIFFLQQQQRRFVGRWSNVPLSPNEKADLFSSIYVLVTNLNSRKNKTPDFKHKRLLKMNFVWYEHIFPDNMVLVHVTMFYARVHRL